MISQMNSQNRKQSWKWWTGGTVVGLAVIVGCASSWRMAKVESEKSNPQRGLAALQVPPGAPPEDEQSLRNKNNGRPLGESEMHNGGKMRLPITASFDGDGSISITNDTNTFITIAPEADMTQFSVYIEGKGGLKDLVFEPIAMPEIKAGDVQRIEIKVPALNGSLIVHAAGDVGGVTMTAALELKVKNPNIVKTTNTENKVQPNAKPVEQDATGQLIQPMKAGE